MGSMLLSDLEQAELASRARLLTAAAEADRRVETARSAAAKIEANAEHEIDLALAALRDRYRTQGDTEVAAVESELAQLEGAVGGADASWPAFDTAVATVVAAVLGETRA
jgi:vacuolar-type H+-ATPase subunit H